MVDTTPKGIGIRIRKRRIALGWSQLKLANELKIPQQTVAGWETGKAKRPRFLLEAANALCTTQQWLLREEGPEETEPVVTKDQIANAIDSLDPRLRRKVLELIESLSMKDANVA